MALDVIANPAVGGVPGVRGRDSGLSCDSRDSGRCDGRSVRPVEHLHRRRSHSGRPWPSCQTPLLPRGHVNETIANANFTLDGGEYGVQTPWSDRGIGLNFGGEYRKESLDYLPDIQFQPGDGAGQGAPTLPVSGHFDVREAFAELQIPIVSHSLLRGTDGRRRLPLFGLQGRRATTSTPTPTSCRWSSPRSTTSGPAPATTARSARRTWSNCSRRSSSVSAERSTRAPARRPTATAAQCLNTGVAAGQYGTIAANPANQYNALFGGNTDLAAGKGRHLHGRRRAPAAVRPGLRLHGRLFRHQGEGLISTLASRRS